MKCNQCPTPAAFLCKCTNIYLCPAHIGSHLQTISRRGHPFEHLSQLLSPQEHSHLSSELRSRINNLQHLKTCLISCTNKLIKSICEFSLSSTTEISNLLSRYSFLLNQDNLCSESIEEIKSILKTELITNKFDPSYLMQQIEIFYSQDLYLIKDNLINQLKIKHNKFLETHNGPFWCLEVTFDGKFLISGSSDTTVRVWDLANKEQVCCFTEHKGTVKCLAISRNNELVASGSDDKRVILWSLNKLECVKVLNGHSADVCCVGFDMQGKLAISATGIGEVMAWSLGNYQCVRRVMIGYEVFCAKVFDSNVWVAGL